MSYKYENALILQTVAWVEQTALALRKAGGNEWGFIHSIPDEVKITMVRNNLTIMSKNPETTFCED